MILSDLKALIYEHVLENVRGDILHCMCPLFALNTEFRSGVGVDLWLWVV